MLLGGSKAVLVRAIALAASSCEPPASGLNLIFEWMNQVGAYLMLELLYLIHRDEPGLAAFFG
jgi:hypothetical protein